MSANIVWFNTGVKVSKSNIFGHQPRCSTYQVYAKLCILSVHFHLEQQEMHKRCHHTPVPQDYKHLYCSESNLFHSAKLFGNGSLERSS